MRLDPHSLTSPTSLTPLLLSKASPKNTRSAILFSSKQASFHPKPSSVQALNPRCLQGSPRPPSLKNPEPPWLVLPPATYFSSDAPPFPDLHVDNATTAAKIASSLRLVQMRKRPACSGLVGLEPVGKAVFALAGVMEELQRLVIYDDEGEALARASRDTGDAVVWLFRRVFVTSPNLVVGLLDLVGSFVALSAERAIPTATTVINEFLKETLDGPEGLLPVTTGSVEIGKSGCWSEVGILDEAECFALDAGSLDYERRRVTYEKMIAAEETNSLLLSNYAQFLYKFAKDLNKAEVYFKRAVESQPADAEAMHRYASFLWHEREDTEAAEEMFLEAIALEPENPHYRSSYASFIWNTGGSGYV